MEGEDLERNASYAARIPYSFKSLEIIWIPLIIPLFITANLIVYEVTMFISMFMTCPIGQCEILPAFTLNKLGALDWYKVVHEREGWRLVTCMWLHAGLIHLLANMWSLNFIGIRLELKFGFVRIGIIYLLSGFGGNVLSCLFIRDNRISVGASGAVVGLLGAMLSELITNWTIYSDKAAALIILMVTILVVLAVRIFPRVDNFGHIGGLLTGFLLGFVLLVRPQFGWMERDNLPPASRAKSKYKAYQYILWLIAVVLLVVGYVVGLTMLFSGVDGNDRCHWCHYLN